MKINLQILKVVALPLFLSGIFFLTNCTKQGPQGQPGLDGHDGHDGAESCSECHNTSELLTGKIAQYKSSVHASGHNVDRNYQPCNRCHTSMGFRHHLEGETKASIDNPTPINCRTCHPIHETYTTDDFSLRTTAAVQLDVSEATYDYKNSNICVNCHQARVMDPAPGLSSDEKFTIFNPYYGPHHATQANMFMGEGPVKIPGSMTYVNSVHNKLVKGGCVDCHMSAPVGTKAGGHQMNITYESYGNNAYLLSGCSSVDCHASPAEAEALLSPNRKEIAALEEELYGLLKSKGLLNEKGLVPVPKEVTAMEAAAITNYKFTHGDYSHGAHNYRFTKALLVNTIESLKEE